jgi:hypothetical protein
MIPSLQMVQRLLEVLVEEEDLYSVKYVHEICVFFLFVIFIIIYIYVYIF